MCHGHSKSSTRSSTAAATAVECHISTPLVTALAQAAVLVHATQNPQIVLLLRTSAACFALQHHQRIAFDNLAGAAILHALLQVIAMAGRGCMFNPGPAL
jgi:hypothetical protein